MTWRSVSTRPYPAAHRTAGMPRFPLALDLDQARVDEQGLLNPLAIMSENAERLTQSMAPPRTLDFLDKGIEAGLAPVPFSATFADSPETTRVEDA